MNSAAQLISASRRVHVGQGERFVTCETEVMLSTILGSCVAACIRDPAAGVGGMNHFLLPAGGSGGDENNSRYGANAMELLINEILKAGGRRERLTAKLFGGARMFDDLRGIGDDNAAFAQKFLSDEGIRVESTSLGGRSARRVHYWPATGKALVRVVEDAASVVGAAERRYAQQKPAAEASIGEVELF
jgi:chemotaxis protein CheD